MVMTSEKIWPVSVTDLLGYFREAMLALVPIADKVQMRWRGPHNYDDWDNIATTLFNSIVIQSIENDAEGQSLLPLPEYDLLLRSYADFSDISTTNLPNHAFVRFETAETPFDTCAFVHLDETGVVLSEVRARVEGTQFRIVGRKAGSIVDLSNLNVVL